MRPVSPDMCLLSITLGKESYIAGRALQRIRQEAAGEQLGGVNVLPCTVIRCVVIMCGIV
jgi:hypothetical protein